MPLISSPSRLFLALAPGHERDALGDIDQGFAYSLQTIDVHVDGLLTHLFCDGVGRNNIFDYHGAVQNLEVKHLVACEMIERLIDRALGGSISIPFHHASWQS
jgi:hypothetical protein